MRPTKSAARGNNGQSQSDVTPKKHSGLMPWNHFAFSVCLWQLVIINSPTLRWKHTDSQAAHLGFYVVLVSLTSPHGFYLEGDAIAKAKGKKVSGITKRKRSACRCHFESPDSHLSTQFTGRLNSQMKEPMV